MVNFKFPIATKGDIEWEETRSDAKNGFAMKFCIDIVMHFLTQIQHSAEIELSRADSVGYTACFQWKKTMLHRETPEFVLGRRRTMGQQNCEGHLRLVYITKLRDLSRVGARPWDSKTVKGICAVCTSQNVGICLGSEPDHATVTLWRACAPCEHRKASGYSDQQLKGW